MDNVLREKKPVDVLLSEYRPWSWAAVRWNTIVSDGKLEKLKEYLLAYYPDGLNCIQLNRILCHKISSKPRPTNMEEELAMLFSEWNKMFGGDLFDESLLDDEDVFEEYKFDDYAHNNTIIIPDGVQEIKGFGFAQYEMTEIKIPNGVQCIGNYAFLSCPNLKNITIPDSVTVIGRVAFGFCRSLESVIISGNEITIDDHAFFNCSKLKSITIPEGLTHISYGLFSGCRALLEINYEGTKESWKAIKKERCWRSKSGICTIKCTDGIIKLPKS